MVSKAGGPNHFPSALSQKAPSVPRVLAFWVRHPCCYRRVRVHPLVSQDDPLWLAARTSGRKFCQFSSRAGSTIFLSLARNSLPRRRIALSEGGGRLIWPIPQSSLSRHPNSKLHLPRSPGLPGRPTQFLRCPRLRRALLRQAWVPSRVDRLPWTPVPRIAALTIARAVISGSFAGAPMRTSGLPPPGNNESGLSSH